MHRTHASHQFSYLPSPTNCTLHHKLLVLDSCMRHFLPPICCYSRLASLLAIALQKLSLHAPIAKLMCWVYLQVDALRILTHCLPPCGYAPPRIHDFQTRAVAWLLDALPLSCSLYATESSCSHHLRNHLLALTFEHHTNRPSRPRQLRVCTHAEQLVVAPYTLSEHLIILTNGVALS